MPILKNMTIKDKINNTGHKQVYKKRKLRKGDMSKKGETNKDRRGQTKGHKHEHKWVEKQKQNNTHSTKRTRQQTHKQHTST